MLFDDDNDKSTTTIKPSIRSPSSFIETTNMNINPLSEIEVFSDQNTNENNEQISNDITEEEIQTEQIKNIYHLLNDVNLTTTDFLNQLQMYGLQIDDESELELP